MSATRKTKPDTSGPREADFYPTPAWAVEAVAELMLDSRPKDMPVIYEPGAGDGAILRALSACAVVGPDGPVTPRRAKMSDFRGCEIRDEAAARCRAMGYTVHTLDFLAHERPVAYAGEIGLWPMNAPYCGRENLAQRFIMRALDLAHDGASVWALLRINWLLDGEASVGRQAWMRNGPGTPNVYALNKRPSFTGDGRADATTYCWAQWVKGFPFQRPEFRIIDCHGGERAATHGPPGEQVLLPLDERHGVEQLDPLPW